MTLCYNPVPKSIIPKGGRLWCFAASAIEFGFVRSAGKSKAAKSKEISSVPVASAPTPLAATLKSPTPTVIRAALNAESKKSWAATIGGKYDSLSRVP